MALATREGNYKFIWLLNKGIEDIDKDYNSLIKSKVDFSDFNKSYVSTTCFAICMKCEKLFHYNGSGN